MALLLSLNMLNIQAYNTKYVKLGAKITRLLDIQIFFGHFSESASKTDIGLIKWDVTHA